MVHVAHTFAVPYHPSAVGRARAELRAWLRPDGAADAFVEDAALVLSELVTNAVCHARPTLTNDVGVEVRLDGTRLHVAVTDGGADGTPEPAPTPGAAFGGRGLAIVGSLTDRWWWEPSGQGRTVHAVLHRPSAPG